MNKRALGTLAAVAAFAGVLGAAPTASAVPNPPGCEKGNFCIYSGPESTGQLVLKSTGNWSGRVTGRSILNNGTPFPGFDHIQVDIIYPDTGSSDTTCLHYNPGPGAIGLTHHSNLIFTKVTWRGEC
jgi:hypothetical protein